MSREGFGAEEEEVGCSIRCGSFGLRGGSISGMRVGLLETKGKLVPVLEVQPVVRSWSRDLLWRAGNEDFLSSLSVTPPLCSVIVPVPEARCRA